MLAGVVNAKNIFATTGTNVSVIYIDKNINEDVVLIDASILGEKIKEKNQKTVFFRKDEENKIINTYLNKEVVDDFSVVVSNEDIKKIKTIHLVQGSTLK